LLVGDPHANPAGGIYAGAAYLFDGLTGDLLETYANPAPWDAQDPPSDHYSSDHFGNWVAAAGTDVLVVAASDDTYGHNTRTAYLFEGPVVPEPGALVLLASGGFGLLLGAVCSRARKPRNERKPCWRSW
jgi:hypothetical protein